MPSNASSCQAAEQTTVRVFSFTLVTQANHQCRGQDPIVERLCDTRLFVSVPHVSERRGSLANPGATTWPSEWRQNTINVHADFSLARLVPLIRATSVLCRTVPHTLNLSPSSESIQVYLFQRKDTFEQYLSHHFPTAPTRRALFVKQQGPGMVFAFDSAELATDLRHETTHAVSPHAVTDRASLA